MIGCTIFIQIHHSFGIVMDIGNTNPEPVENGHECKCS